MLAGVGIDLVGLHLEAQANAAHQSALGFAQQTAAPVVAPSASKVVLNADTFFDFDKSTIKPEGRQVLDQVAAQASGMNLETIIAVGHTDSTGPEQYNLGLSQRRANAVKNYLVKEGVPASSMTAKGYGLTMPKFDNRTEEGRRLNRRAEINPL